MEIILEKNINFHLFPIFPFFTQHQIKSGGNEAKRTDTIENNVNGAIKINLPSFPMNVGVFNQNVLTHLPVSPIDSGRYPAVEYVLFSVESELLVLMMLTKYKIFG